MSRAWPEWSRRTLMYLVIGIQLVILAAIVSSQEINRLFDTSVAVELEISRAYASKDPFRGASVSGRPALDLEGTKVRLPARRLEPGDKVLVFFRVEPGGRPRITEITRRKKDPPFSANRFSIAGKVREENARKSFSSAAALVARIGTPPVAVELDLPGSITIDESVLKQLSRPSLIHASLRQGFLGHRYFDNVGLSGYGWSHEMSFTYDERRDHLLVLAQEETGFQPRRRTADQAPRTRVFIFDGQGKEVRSVEVAGRLTDGWMNPTDGKLWALMTGEAWAYSPVQLVILGEDGSIGQRGPHANYEQIVGINAHEGSLWVVTGPRNPPPGTPYFVERLTLGGFQGPRLGPFLSKPGKVLTENKNIWVMEPDQHRVTRFDLGGNVEKEYRDLNRPTEIVVDAGFLMIVEANQTQLSQFSMEGKTIWRIPRFQRLAWILPDSGTGAGWFGAERFEGREGGVFRYEPNGRITLLSGIGASRTDGAGGSRPRLVPNAIRSSAHGRLYIREDQSVLILSPDGNMQRRVEGFRFATGQPVRR